MDITRIQNVVATLSGDEMPFTLSLVGLCLRCGTMRVAEAEEWRRQISARQAFLEFATSTCH
jgi:hypothetical protein